MEDEKSDRDHYEQMVLTGVRERLESGAIEGLRLRELSLEGSFPDTGLVLLFEHDSRRRCVFGFKFPVWSDDVQQHDDSYFPTMEFIINLREEIEAPDLGLPGDCSPEDVTWIA
jgi:hypothetical protein